jgi:hypothetical protein
MVSHQGCHLSAVSGFEPHATADRARQFLAGDGMIDARTLADVVKQCA